MLKRQRIENDQTIFVGMNSSRPFSPPELAQATPVMTCGWMYPQNKLTHRHSGKANVALADGHVETVKPEFGDQPEHYDPLQ